MKLLLLFFSLSIFAQLNLKHNFNVNAKELRHSIIEDSLILSSDFEIKTVVIRSTKERRTYFPNLKKLNLHIGWIPKGRCFVIVVTNRKIITFNIEKE